MLLHYLVQLVHSRVPVGRDLLSEVVDHSCIELGLCLHLLSQLFDILLFAFQLLIFLLDHLLKGLDCLISSI